MIYYKSIILHFLKVTQYRTHALIFLSFFVITILFVILHSSKKSLIIFVTTLENDGPGSLRECVERINPRICDFSVSGTIELNSNIEILNPHLTIRGETAPSPGITLVGAGIIIRTKDVYISHLRVRPGDALTGPDPEDRDAFRIESGAYQVTLDHVSTSFGVDENIDIWGEDISDITISNSIVSDALDDSIHPEGPHSKGMLVGAEFFPPQRVSIVRNLFAHNKSRNPLINNAFVANNVIFDWGTSATHIRGSTTPAVSSEVSVIGNIYLNPNTDNKSHPILIDKNTSRDSKIFVHDNTLNNVLFILRDEFPVSNKTPWTPRDYEILSSNETLDYVLKNVGARPNDRDDIDINIIRDVIEQRTGILDCIHTCTKGKRINRISN